MAIFNTPSGLSVDLHREIHSFGHPKVVKCTERAAFTAAARRGFKLLKIRQRCDDFWEWDSGVVRQSSLVCRGFTVTESMARFGTLWTDISHLSQTNRIMTRVVGAGDSNYRRDATSSQLHEWVTGEVGLIWH
ncbi:hypothetical protein FCV25MIE_25383 [Fagus crenata]